MFGSREWALRAGIGVVAALLAMELVAEPFRVLGLHYKSNESDEHGNSADNSSPLEPLLWTAPARPRLDVRSVAALRRIHEEAFPPGEQQYDVEFILRNEGRHGFLLLLLTEPAGQIGAHEVAGYVFLQARPKGGSQSASQHRRCFEEFSHPVGRTVP